MLVAPELAPLMVAVDVLDVDPLNAASPAYVTVNEYVPGVRMPVVKVARPAAIVTVPRAAAVGAVWLTVAVPVAVLAVVPSDAFLIVVEMATVLAVWSAAAVIEVLVLTLTTGTTTDQV
jgi:hypothetical protein